MRTLSGTYRRKLRSKQARRRIALCQTLTNSGGMVTGPLRTAKFDDKARRDLGNAVIAARKAVFRRRSEFLRAHPDVKPTSLYLIEHAKPLVGSLVLEAVGEALAEHFPGLWTKETPQRILSGEAPPDISQSTPASPVIKPEVDTEPVDTDAHGESITGYPVGSDEWLDHYADDPVATRAGLDVREKRRDLEKAEDYVRRLLTERRLSHGASSDSP